MNVPGFLLKHSLAQNVDLGNMSSHQNSVGSKNKGIWPLTLVNFFMADMQAGIGPFLGTFLLAHGWKSGPIGTVMTIGGVAGMLVTAPAGALIDETNLKRLFVVIPGIAETAGEEHVFDWLAGHATKRTDG